MSLVVLSLARSLGIDYWLGYTCDAKQKAALKEFPQYGGRTLRTSTLGGEGLNFPLLETPPPGCDLGFMARHASLKQVSTCYEKKLSEHGWTVKRFAVSRKREFEHPQVDGIRDGFHHDRASTTSAVLVDRIPPLGLLRVGFRCSYPTSQGRR